jgi:hypothetical protein
LKSSNGATSQQQWGTFGDVPSSSDYDGDSVADFALRRANLTTGQATFYLLESTAGFQAFAWGANSDVIVPGDYDGDGKTDLAIVRGASGELTWWVRRSSDASVLGMTWGLVNDVLTPGDYDGDGKSDIAVWRTGAQAMFFAFRSSTSTMLSQPWGTTGDYPPANFVDSGGTVAPNLLISFTGLVDGQVLDTPFTITGWAIDRAAASGTGVDLVQLDAIDNGGQGTTHPLGTASYGDTSLPQTAVAAQYGQQFLYSTFTKNVGLSALSPGLYLLKATARSTVSGQLEVDQPHTVLVYVDMPDQALNVTATGPGTVTSNPVTCSPTLVQGLCDSGRG